MVRTLSSGTAAKAKLRLARGQDISILSLLKNNRLMLDVLAHIIHK
jgi:hypothetical protein